MKNSIFTFFILSAVVAGAQDFSIKKVEVDGDKVNILYDLNDPDPNRTYTISLYSSKDNFISQLDKVAGDVGLEIKPGGNKKISWSAAQELGPDFEGDVSLEVRGRVYIPFVRLDGLQSVMKRSRENEITWSGGTQQNILNFDLYKGEEKITSFPNIANVGHYTLILPSHTKPGSGYRFKITDSKNKDQIVYSKTFVVKRKIPLLLQAAPIILAGGAVFLLLPKKAEDKSIKDPVIIDDILK